MLELNYLQSGDLTKDNDFSGEVVFRRCFPKENPLFPNEFFTSTRADDFINGISLNRSKFCRSADHVRYNSILDPDSGNCTYTLRDESVSVECPVSELVDLENASFKAKVKVEHDPVLCNRSHSLLCFNPVPNARLEKLAAKAFLNSLFKISVTTPAELSANSRDAGKGDTF